MNFKLISLTIVTMIAFAANSILCRLALVTTTAAIIQLSVPAIAAFGGVLFLGESVHMRLIISSLFIFGGIIIKIRAN